MRIHPREAMAAVGRHLRSAPLSVALAVAVAVAVVVAPTVGWPRPLVLDRLPAAWPDLLTSPVSTPDPWRALVAVVGLLALGGAAERRLGTLRYAVVGLGGHLASVLLTWGLASAVRPVDPAWAEHLRSAPVATPWPWVAVTAMAASVPLPTLWRRRVWSAVLPVLVVTTGFAGEPQDMVVLVAAVLGVVVGARLFPGRLRRARVVGSRHEVRVLAATSVAAVVVGTLLTLGAPHLVGPLSATRFLFAQATYTPAEVAALCAGSGGSPECDRAVYVLRGTGIGSTVLSVLPLLLQLALAEGLRRGRRAALVGTLLLQGLLAVLAAAHLSLVLQTREPWLAGGHLDLDLWPLPGARLVAPVVVPCLVAAVVLLVRHAFDVRAPRGTYQRFWAGVGLAVGAVVLAVLLGGLAVRHQFVPAATLPGLLVDTGVALLPSTALTVLTPLLLPVGPVARLLLEWLPVLPWVAACVLLLRALGPVDDRGADREAYRALVRQVAPATSTLSWLGTWAGNQVWTSPTRRGAVAYRAWGGVALTVADPVCAEADLEVVVGEFAEHCAARSLVPALYSVHEGTGQAAARLGWASVQVAEETVLPLGQVAFRGKAFQDVRTAINRAARDGVAARWTTWAQASTRTREQVRAISEEWVADKALPEMGFTLGGLAELDDPAVRLLVAEDGEGTVHGVTSWLPVHDAGAVVGLTLDVMRRRQDGFRPVVEFLIARAALDAQAEGMELLSLSGAPLARAGPPDTLLDRVLDLLGRTLEPVYGFRTLHAFKAKFGVTYAPLLLCLPDPADLPLVGAAVAHAYLPDARLADTVRLGRALARPDP